MSDDANIEVNGTTYYFRDFAGKNTTDYLNKLIKQAGSDGTTCYVVEKGVLDCVDAPAQPYCLPDLVPP